MARSASLYPQRRPFAVWSSRTLEIRVRLYRNAPLNAKQNRPVLFLKILIPIVPDPEPLSRARAPPYFLRPENSGRRGIREPQPS